MKHSDNSRIPRPSDTFNILASGTKMNNMYSYEYTGLSGLPVKLSTTLFD